MSDTPAPETPDTPAPKLSVITASLDDNGKITIDIRPMKDNDELLKYLKELGQAYNNYSVTASVCVIDGNVRDIKLRQNFYVGDQTIVMDEQPPKKFMTSEELYKTIA